MRPFAWAGRALVVAAVVALTSASVGAFADTLPGDGKTIRYAQSDSLGGNYVAAQIVMKAMKALGYDVQTQHDEHHAVLPGRGAQGETSILPPMSIFPSVNPASRPWKSRRRSWAGE